MPQNIEAEAALLGAMMLDNRLVEDIQIRLRPEHFFEPLHGRVYDAILRLMDRNMLATPGDRCGRCSRRTSACASWAGPPIWRS